MEFTDRKISMYWEENLSKYQFSTINLTKLGLETKPDIRGDRILTKLNYCLTEEQQTV